MQQPSVKLVAADMDGTLLNSRHELSPAFFPMLHQLRARGILFAAASGRQYYNLLNRFADVQDEVIFVAENGSYVVHRGHELLVQAMDRELAKAQLRLALSIPDVEVVLCGKKQAYVQHSGGPFMDQVNMYYDKYTIVDNLLTIEDDEFLKIAICDLAGSETHSYTYFQQSQEHLQVKVSGRVWLDISHRLANKGRALAVLQEKFGATVAETMVFGDYLNDLEMMQQAYYSFAMENAHPDIKAAARFRARSNDENGVLEVVQQLLNGQPIE